MERRKTPTAENRFQRTMIVVRREAQIAAVRLAKQRLLARRTGQKRA
jgi:hypothetical protein